MVLLRHSLRRYQVVTCIDDGFQDLISQRCQRNLFVLEELWTVCEREDSLILRRVPSDNVEPLAFCAHLTEINNGHLKFIFA